MSYINSSLLQCFWEDYIHVPRRIMFSGVTVDSFLTFLNGATMSLSHSLSLIAARRPFNVSSAFVTSVISFNVMTCVMARGTACLVTVCLLDFGRVLFQ